MLIVHPGIVVRFVPLSLIMEMNAYTAVDVIFQILDALMRRIFALDVYRHGYPVDARNIHHGSEIRGPLDFNPGA